MVNSEDIVYVVMRCLKWNVVLDTVVLFILVWHMFFSYQLFFSPFYMFNILEK